MLVFPWPCLQELHTAAEPLRQNEVMISVLKNTAWQKTLEWARATDFALTGEVPAKNVKPSSEEPLSKKSKWIEWERDELKLAVKTSIGSDDELVKEAHYSVEYKLSPAFL